MSNQSHREIAAPDVATPKLTGSIRKGGCPCIYVTPEWGENINLLM